MRAESEAADAGVAVEKEREATTRSGKLRETPERCRSVVVIPWALCAMSEMIRLWICIH